MCLGPRAVDSLRYARASAGPAAEAQDVRPTGGSALSVLRRFFLLTGTHFVLTFATLLWSLAIAMAAFNGEGSGLGGSTLFSAHRVLSFPLGSFGGRWLAQIHRGGFPLEHLFFLLNSFVWAAAGMWLWRRVSHWMVARRADGQ